MARARRGGSICKFKAIYVLQSTSTGYSIFFQQILYKVVNNSIVKKIDEIRCGK